MAWTFKDAPGLWLHNVHIEFLDAPEDSLHPGLWVIGKIRLDGALTTLQMHHFISWPIGEVYT